MQDFYFNVFNHTSWEGANSFLVVLLDTSKIFLE